MMDFQDEKSKLEQKGKEEAKDQIDQRLDGDKQQSQQDAGE